MKQYKRPEISTGSLNKPVDFFKVTSSDGPEAHTGGSEELLYHCMADVYESSMKDITRNDVSSAKKMVTMKIRDTVGGYLPQNTHRFRINHYKYPRDYQVIDVAPDTSEDGFMKVIGESFD
ncbi:phage head-tail adapter protein [Salinicoccus roseus]|uniref:phage head-tail adapter protein n=1 Tax=Salinicoccus roseus TaxID=45670 RepID=UPI00230137F2|nr:phage head-tail adapter protein [Salinicoccus roseus]